MVEQTTSKALGKEKPALLRVIFILNAIKIPLAFVFYYLLKNDIIAVELDPMITVYTGIAYAVLFAFMVFFIIKRNLWGLRIVIIIDLLSSLPSGAAIGILISLISFGLSFSKQVKTYFAYSE